VEERLAGCALAGGGHSSIVVGDREWTGRPGRPLTRATERDARAVLVDGDDRVRRIRTDGTPLGAEGVLDLFDFGVPLPEGYWERLPAP
jgi:hypothetical protein